MSFDASTLERFQGLLRPVEGLGRPEVARDVERARERLQMVSQRPSGQLYLLVDGDRR